MFIIYSVEKSILKIDELEVCIDLWQKKILSHGRKRSCTVESYLQKTTLKSHVKLTFTLFA